MLFIAFIFLSGCASNKASTSANPLKNIRFWAYQIQDQNAGDNLEKLIDSHYDLLVIDQTRSLKGESSYDSKKEVDMLKDSKGQSGKNKIVLCYLDVGEAESYRWYWRDGWRVGNPDWIVTVDPDGWDENYPVKFWKKEWKTIVKKSIDMIIDDGYDGLYLDWLEVYSNVDVATAAQREDLDPKTELIDFIKDLGSYARSKRASFIIVAQNGAELGDDEAYLDVFDGISQEAIWYDGGGDPDGTEQVGNVEQNHKLTKEYLDYLDVWKEAGKPVLDVEYATDSDKVRRAYELGREDDFKTYVTTRPLNKLTDTPPPGY